MKTGTKQFQVQGNAGKHLLSRPFGRIRPNPTKSHLKKYIFLNFAPVPASGTTPDRKLKITKRTHLRFFRCACNQIV